MKKELHLLPVLFILIFAFSLFAQGKKAQYVGAAKCKMCHKSVKSGEQYKKWENGPHAKAFATLATEEAKTVATKAGVTGNPQESAKCLKCHVTAFDAPASDKAATFKQDEGVGCEACHGPGSLYKSMKVMKDLAAGKQDAKAVSYTRGSKETCLTCHNSESPTYKAFNYEEFFAQIAHPVPAAK